jgi:hypothetical protein
MDNVVFVAYMRLEGGVHAAIRLSPACGAPLGKQGWWFDSLNTCSHTVMNR